MVGEPKNQLDVPRARASHAAAGRFCRVGAISGTEKTGKGDNPS